MPFCQCAFGTHEGLPRLLHGTHQCSPSCRSSFQAWPICPCLACGQGCAAFGGQFGTWIPNCLAYSAFRRCQPNFIASPATMRPMGLPARNRSRTSKQMCQPAAPIDTNPRSILCQRVRRVPLPSGSSSHRMSLPPQLYSSSREASARFTLVAETCGGCAPTVASFTGPTSPRLRSASNGAHSRSCAGSVNACQTFAGGWRSSRTRISVHFSPSFRTSAPAAGPGAYVSRLLIVSFLSGVATPDPYDRGGVRERPGYDQRRLRKQAQPHKPLVSYRINRQLSGWVLPPLMIRAFGPHCQVLTFRRALPASMIRLGLVWLASPNPTASAPAASSPATGTSLPAAEAAARACAPAAWPALAQAAAAARGHAM